MRCILSDCVDSATFARLALALAREGADMLLCHPAPDGGGMPPGWTASDATSPARPCCLVGFDVAGEISPPPDGDLTDLNAFCFGDGTQQVRIASDVPRLAFGWLSYGWGMALHGIASAKPAESGYGVLRRYHCLLRWYPHGGDLEAEVSATGQRRLPMLRRLLDALRTEERAHTLTETLTEEHREAGTAMRQEKHGAPRAAATGKGSGGDGGDNPYGDVRNHGEGRGLSGAPRDGTAPDDDLALALDELVPSLDATTYPDGVRQVLAAIRRGDTYQLNLTSRFTARRPGMDAAAVLLRLWQHRPAPFAAYLHAGRHRILSLSPERFLRVRGGEVLAQPIKGTRSFDPATTSPGERARLEAALRADPKEHAELSMVVDLLRNDISATCAYDSVRVPRHCATFAVGPLIQMCSDVTGTLRDGTTCLDLLRHAFPGGSVTGCPKPRTMSLIERIEPHPRDVYCGSLVAVAGPRDMDSSIAIRTALYDTTTGLLHLYAGSGLTVDSDPEGEYRETVDKTSAFRKETA